MPSSDEKRRQKKLAKKTVKRKAKLAGRRLESPARAPETLAIYGYEITDEPIPETNYERLPAKVKDELTALYDGILFQHPGQALVTLKPLIERYPDVPQLYNYLYSAYQLLNDRANARQVLQETLVRFPDYLFGRIAYANYCLQRGKVEKVPEIFEGHFDLKGLYPKRQRFHISEVLGFCAVMARYFHSKGDLDQSKRYFELMHQLDPEHRSTQDIRVLLQPSRFDTMLRSLLNKKS